MAEHLPKVRRSSRLLFISNCRRGAQMRCVPSDSLTRTPWNRFLTRIIPLDDLSTTVNRILRLVADSVPGPSNIVAVYKAAAAILALTPSFLHRSTSRLQGSYQGSFVASSAIFWQVSVPGLLSRIWVRKSHFSYPILACDR